MNACFFIHFDELKPETQKQLLKFMRVADPADLNWDVFPIAYVSRARDQVDDTKREKRSYDSPQDSCIWDLSADEFHEFLYDNPICDSSWLESTYF
jgi:hypothetical protein